MSVSYQNIRIKNFIHGEWVEETGVDSKPLFNPSTYLMPNSAIFAKWDILTV